MAYIYIAQLGLLGASCDVFLRVIDYKSPSAVLLQ